MRIASMGNPNEYSGIGVAEVTIKLNVGVCWIEIELGPSEPAPLEKMIGEIAKSSVTEAPSKSSNTQVIG
jgi:hypothetical protein